MPVLVVGNFPPVPGPTTEATLEVVRRRLTAGDDVRTASPRASGAELVVPAAGLRGGVHLQRARRLTGADEVVLALGPGVPADPRPRLRAVVAVLSLAIALRGFGRVTVVVAEDPGLPPFVLRPFWKVSSAVLVAGAELAGRLAVPTRLVEHLGEVPHVAGLVQSWSVTSLGPPEVRPQMMPRYVAGRVARKALGPAFDPAWAAVRRVGGPAMRRIRPALQAIRRWRAR